MTNQQEERSLSIGSAVQIIPKGKTIARTSPPKAGPEPSPVDQERMESQESRLKHSGGAR